MISALDLGRLGMVHTIESKGMYFALRKTLPRDDAATSTFVGFELR